MANGITGIDHPVIAIADMGTARATYERLGFTVPPRGSHLEWGTGNWCIMFADDYLELRGIVDASRYTHGVDDFLERRGEGLMGVAFATVGAEQSHAMLSENGFRPREVVHLSRNFELPDGWVQPAFALCFPADEEVPGLMSVVLCEHKTPELVRRPEFLEHANGTRRIASMTGIMAEPASARPAMQRLLGAGAVRLEGRQLVLDCGRGQSIRQVPPDEFAALHGEARFDGAPALPYLAAIVLEVDALAKTETALAANGVPFSKAGGRLRVAPQHGCGVLYEFVEAG